MQSDTIGVIVARFQIPELHEGHRSLIEYVRDRHETVLIVLASPGGEPTRKNPLRYSVRKHMVDEAYPGMHFAEIVDHPIAATYWSRDLDALITARFPNRAAMLYGSRQSFIDVYSGTFPTVLVQSSTTVCGTSIRDAVPEPTTKAGREALIWTTNSRFPIQYRAVDIAIEDRQQHRFLLIGKKRHEGLLSFPGGHVERGESDEQTAPRERCEEVTGITCGPYTLIRTSPVDDPRYRGTDDGYTTSLFHTRYLYGTPSPGDDADHVEWVPRKQLLERLVPWHRPLGDILLRRVS